MWDRVRKRANLALNRAGKCLFEGEEGSYLGFLSTPEKECSKVDPANVKPPSAAAVTMKPGKTGNDTTFAWTGNAIQL